VTARVRVLVVDDSAFMRTAVARTLASDERIEIAGQARDGTEAVRLTAELSPDVVTMDFNMPGMNGAEAVRAIMADRTVPVIMLSAHTVAGAEETVEALSAGAVDFVTKPDGEVSTDLSGVRDELVRKVLLASRARPQPAPSPDEARTSAPGAEGRVSRPPVSPVRPGTPPEGRGRVSFASMVLDPVVIIAISTGGPAALERVIPRLPAGYSRGVLVVQHIPGAFTRALAKRLDTMSRLEVREVREGERMGAGRVLIAPGDRHVVVDRNGMLKLTETPPVNGCRPSADVTLQSAAPVYGDRLTVVVMTGMGRDGALGAAAARAAGGRVLAQDRETSVVYGMPRAAVDMGVVDEVLPLARIATRLAALARK